MPLLADQVKYIFVLGMNQLLHGSLEHYGKYFPHLEHYDKYFPHFSYFAVIYFIVKKIAKHEKLRKYLSCCTRCVAIASTYYDK